MTCETTKEAWDVLKELYQGNERTRRMQVLNLKRDIETLNMKENKIIQEYSDQLTMIVNKIQLLEEDY